LLAFTSAVDPAVSGDICFLLWTILLFFGTD
jgi:hypothetical protein